MKDAGLRIRVEPELRERFITICRENDLPAAQVLRSFMRDYIKTNEREREPNHPLPNKRNTLKQVP